MKVAFIGTHGVGKTTLCFDLAGRLKRLDISVDIVKEVARHCPLPINRNTTFEAQAWILHTQIAEEIAVASRYEAVVCDRSVIDNYAYLVHRLGPRAELEPMIRHWMHGYDGLFKVPILGAPSFDGTRDLSVGFQREIDIVIDELMQRLGIRYHALDPAGRGRWIEDVVEALGLPPRAPQIGLFDDPS